jgi:histidine triad (HIT) family protein
MAALGKLLVVARRLAEQEHIVDGYRLAVNSRPRAGQSVFHMHVHLLGGRWAGHLDNLFTLGGNHVSQGSNDF